MPRLELRTDVSCSLAQSDRLGGQPRATSQSWKGLNRNGGAKGRAMNPGTAPVDVAAPAPWCDPAGERVKFPCPARIAPDRTGAVSPRGVASGVMRRWPARAVSIPPDQAQRHVLVKRPALAAWQLPGCGPYFANIGSPTEGARFFRRPLGRCQSGTAQLRSGSWAVDVQRTCTACNTRFAQTAFNYFVHRKDGVDSRPP